MKAKTSSKAGGVQLNHNESLVRDAGKAVKARARGLKVKTVKASGLQVNHNETLVRDVAPGVRRR